MSTKALPEPSTVAYHEPDAQEMRCCLLRVAAQEFANCGFASVRPKVVAVEACIAQAMAYYYFGGRGRLYTAVLEDAYQVIWLAQPYGCAWRKLGGERDKPWHDVQPPRRVGRYQSLVKYGRQECRSYQGRDQCRSNLCSMKVCKPW